GRMRSGRQRRGERRWPGLDHVRASDSSEGSVFYRRSPPNVTPGGQTAIDQPRRALLPAYVELGSRLVPLEPAKYLLLDGSRALLGVGREAGDRRSVTQHLPDRPRLGLAAPNRVVLPPLPEYRHSLRHFCSR